MPVLAGQGHTPVQVSHGIVGPEADDPDRRFGLLLVQMSRAPVEQGVGVARVQVDGLVEILQRPARVAHLGVGAGPAVVGVGVLRDLLDQPVEVLDGLFKLSHSIRAKALAARAPVWSGSISRRAPKSSMALS